MLETSKFKLFIIVLSLFCCNVFCKKERVCPVSECESFNIRQTIVNMWNIPSDQTRLIGQYRNALISLLHDSDSRTLAMLTAQTLWSVDMLTDLESKTHPSCVYGNLVTTTLANQRLKSVQSRDALDQAVIEYGNLCGAAVNYTVYIGLKAAGCSASYKDIDSSEPCNFGNSIKEFLESDSIEIPDSLKVILKKMLKSQKSKDVDVATAVIGGSTKSSIDIFEKYLANPELLSVMRQKCCKVKINKKCCGNRGFELRTRCEQLYVRTLLNIEEIIDNNRKI